MFIDRSYGVGYGLTILFTEDNRKSLVELVKSTPVVNHSEEYYELGLNDILPEEYDDYDMEVYFRSILPGLNIGTVIDGNTEHEPYITITHPDFSNTFDSYDSDLELKTLNVSGVTKDVESEFDKVTHLLNKHNVVYEAPRWFVYKSVF